MPVSFPRTRDISAERCSKPRISIRPLGLF
jgi:hypothetical protein